MIGTHEVLVYVNRDAPTGTPLDMTCLIDEVSVTHGRDDTTSQPEPSSATLNVTVGPGAPLPVEVDIGAWVVVTTILDGVRFTRFTGRITDLTIGWDDEGENTPEAGAGQIIAVGVLGDYARRVVGAEPFPQELDGARIARVFALAGLTLNPATSDPGTVEVIPRDVDARAALEIAQDTALSAGGLIWSNRVGDVRYADADHRRGAAVDLELDACDILVSPTWSRNLSAIVNELTLGYGVEPEPVEGEESSGAPVLVETNPESRARFGRYAYSVTTELATFEDAQSSAWLILTQNREPVWMLDALPVDVGGLPLAASKALLGLDVHGLLRVTGLPATGATPTAIAAWVEGWTERLAFGVHDVELTISDYCRTVPGARWDDYGPALTWDTWGAGSWDEASCQGGPLPSLGRWDDTPATTRWDTVDPSVIWDGALL